MTDADTESILTGDGGAKLWGSSDVGTPPSLLSLQNAPSSGDVLAARFNMKLSTNSQ